MKYQTTFSVRFTTPITSFPKDIHLDIREGEFVLHDVDDEGRTGRATITIVVEPEGLRVGEGNTRLDGSPASKGICVPESSAVTGILRSAVRVLEFVLDGLIHTWNPQDYRLIPESREDEECLENLGSLSLMLEGPGKHSTYNRRFPSLDKALLDKLLLREIGLALYSDALRLSTPIARYREFWRVLESAFGQHHDELVDSLTAFPPTKCLGFDQKELHELRVLRGRASHAQSSAGMEEYHTVSQEVECQLPRLECLAEKVLMTKESWGTEGLGVKPLANS